MKFILRFGCLLIIALAAPIALPAGGGMRDNLEIHYSKERIGCFAGKSCFLFSSPDLSAATLCKVDLGSPLKVIRVWRNDKGQNWIQVKKHYNRFLSLNSNTSHRGWIHV